jgi:EmrB/QacA subfamily drug resistance transporter
VSASKVESSGPDGQPPVVTSLASRLTLVSVASALFMQAIDSTALSTALPTLARAFATDPIHLKLCLTAYIMALAVFVPASAWAADRFGARRVFTTAMGIFLLGSVLCGQSRNLEQLVAFRILQGAGGAMMAPVGRMMVVASHPREQLVKAMVWMTTPGLLGPILGPPLSGFILSIATWPWIFYINVPVGILGMLAVWRFVPKIVQPHPGKFDVVGYLMAAAAICAAMVGAESVGVNLLPLWGQGLVWSFALGVGWTYVRYAAKQERPVLDLKLLKVATFRANQTGGTLMRMTVGAFPFLLPLLLQGGLGWTPWQAGLLTMSIAVGSMSARLGAQFVLRRFGFRNTLMFTAAACGLVISTTGFFRSNTPIAMMVGVLAVGGFLRSNHLTCAGTLAFADIPDVSVSQASSLSSVLQQVAQALGITIAALTLRLSQVVGASHGLGSLAPENFVFPFAVVGFACVSATAIYWTLPADAGANMHGRKRR